MNPYPGPMQPWPTLTEWGRTLFLPNHQFSLFFYDSQFGARAVDDSGLGDRPTLLLIHGLGDEADSWRHVIRPLAEHYRVLALDLPGFGRSQRPAAPLSPPLLCATILELLDVLGIAQVELVGNSLGGLLAQEISLTRPERVRRLVLIGGTLVTRSRSLNRGTLMMLMPGLGEWLYTRLRKDPQAAYETLRPFYADLDALPEGDRTFLFQRVNERVWSNSQRWAYFSVLRSLARWLPSRQRGLDAVATNAAVPTLALWGEADHIVPAENGLALTQLQPNARFVLIPGAGHLPQQETPQPLVDAMIGR